MANACWLSEATRCGDGTCRPARRSHQAGAIGAELGVLDFKTVFQWPEALFAGGCIPHTDPAPPPDGYSPSIGTKAGGATCSFMHREGGERRAGRHVPSPHRVASESQQAFAIVAQGSESQRV